MISVICQELFWVLGHNSKWHTESLPLGSLHSLQGSDKQIYLLWCHGVISATEKEKWTKELGNFILRGRGGDMCAET